MVVVLLGGSGILVIVEQATTRTIAKLADTQDGILLCDDGFVDDDDANEAFVRFRDKGKLNVLDLDSRIIHDDCIPFGK